MRIEASGPVPAPREAVFGFLADLENHWELASRFIEVVSLDREHPSAPAHGGEVRMRGPLGIGRTAHTRVAGTKPPAEMYGTAELASGTLARVAWTFEPQGDGTAVTLCARVERSGALDRLLLLAGGRRWLERRFDDVLSTLASRWGVTSGA